VSILYRILATAGGSGWVAEFLDRVVFDVTTFDIIKKSIVLDEINERASKICSMGMYAWCRFKMQYLRDINNRKEALNYWN
jgi:hypothetical protein